MLRLLGVVTVACVLGAGVGAEDKKDEKKADYAKLIIGKWEVTKADEATGVPVGATVEFTKDGKMIFSAGEGMAFEGAYKMDKNSFIMTHKQGDQENSQKINITKLDDKVLLTKDEKEGKIVELKRKK